MLGRGVDQIMESPGDPTLQERWARSALDYVRLAERRNGTVPRGVGPRYVWGDALATMVEGVAARLINLETAVTGVGDPWPGKGVHYRMSPGNAACLSAAAIDCCVLSNNHVLDWSYPGLDQTLSSLRRAGVAVSGAGRDSRSARAPAVVSVPGGRRVVVVARGAVSSGIPPSWGAGPDRPGVALLGDLGPADVDEIAEEVERVARAGDLVVASIHWGPNWGFAIPETHRRFARALVEQAGVHVVHGHSSHHPVGIEVHRDRPILYGCGDLINDYEGISGHEEYRPELGALYLVTMRPGEGRLQSLELVPVRRRRFRLEAASVEDREWLQSTLSRQGERLGSWVEARGGRLLLRW